MPPLPLRSAVLCGSIKWPLLLLPWHVQQRWFHEEEGSAFIQQLNKIQNNGAHAWPRSPSHVLSLLSSGSHFLTITASQSDSTDTWLVGSESVHWQVFELDFEGAGTLQLPCLRWLSLLSWFSSASGALCATLVAECGVWQNTSFQVYVIESFFTAFQPNPTFKPKWTASTLKTQDLGFPWKSLYYVLYCNVLQNRNPASFSFSLAVFLLFCHFAGESSQ